MKKTLTAILLTILALSFILIFSICAFAAESEENGNADSYSESADENALFAELYRLFLKNADKIFSLLAFSGSLITVIAYRKGLIPVLSTGLTSIKKSSDELEKKSEEALVNTEKTLDVFTNRLIGYENTLQSLSGELEKLGERLLSKEESERNEKLLKEVMLSEIDMLYEIFISSSLPQYSKDAISEKVAKMKKRLVCGEENEKE